jgi:hypothetical protein
LKTAHHSLLLLLLRRTIAILAAHDLLAEIRASEPRHIPGRLVVGDPAACIPAAADALVVLPVLIIQRLALRFGAIHAIEAETVEVAFGV